ncbi:MAG: PLP-dependent transferase, partial [Acidimicrobiales bacterium]
MSDETDDPSTAWEPATWLIAAGRSRQPGQPLNVPPSMASNFYLPSERVYSRVEGTETANAFE